MIRPLQYLAIEYFNHSQLQVHSISRNAIESDQAWHGSLLRLFLVCMPIQFGR
ncbi:hypothetical protein Pla100_50810 [Neorhodopirellula pilleata]|uniref:Uncharacterized protein n=1 Tax=Neorhodopirellula pilleata TaxID=2714738 RepID=A0A5C5ZVR5_9BACT|nr:hypothetical protein Pla100_50810 [Neorhodopirellula pilleata]